MKHKSILLAWILLTSFALLKAEVKLPAVISDNMVLQREYPIKIWGTATAGEAVKLTFKKKEYQTTADAQGQWSIMLPAMKAGGPYEMKVNGLTVKNILIGDLWLCSGQSNMELTVDRVTDMFGKEIAEYENSMIRYAKTPYGNDLHGPQQDLPQMNWCELTKTNATSFAALPYFFAKEMYDRTKIPVGIINSSWGGSSIQAWMSEEALQNFPMELLERDLNNSDEYKALMNKSGALMSRIWDTALYKRDKGLHAATPWYDFNLGDSDWSNVDQFGLAWATDHYAPVNGSHWFRQTIELTQAQASKQAVLRLGCMVDADSVYVNGVFVGSTPYQYPPRIYKVPASILKAGKNVITVRLISYGGMPSFVKDKPYLLALEGGDTIRLSTQWKYRLGAKMLAKRGGVSFQNIPTGMYNSMISPLRNLRFKGAVWYQGETNAGNPTEYEAMMTSLINDWRIKLNDSTLPFIIVQLPNFMQTHAQPVESNWAKLREAERQTALKVPNTALAVTIDLGEWNDIHPLNKKEVAKRVALQAEKLVYGNTKLVVSGPICISANKENGKVMLSFEKGTDDLLPVGKLKGFALAGADGQYKWADASIEGNKVTVWNEEIKQPVSIRYAWDDNPQEANLKNKSGLPASPFEMEITK